ncbi:MAG: FAD-dependent thymidylate synthase [Desulfovibrionaceae bacterium]|nr:FAD-dependent thymidylate synthase [Desulfovibrionaceae bacterium]
MASPQKVLLLAHTPNPLEVIFASFRQCYYNGFIGDVFEDILEGTPSKEEQEQFIANLVKSGHVSPLEHVSFTFAIEGVSRALTHQLVRHRIASYSQQSQRYVTGKNFSYITPPSIEKNIKAKEKYTALMESIQETYQELLTLFQQEDIKAKECIEDIRFILPQAAETRIVVTMNCRALLNFFEHRCCIRAQWEIRALANTMRKECTKILPSVFKESGAPCYSLKYCPEPKHLACGLFPTRD